jgi:hypothetical protein
MILGLGFPIIFVVPVVHRERGPRAARQGGDASGPTFPVDPPGRRALRTCARARSAASGRGCGGNQNFWRIGFSKPENRDAICPSSAGLMASTSWSPVPTRMHPWPLQQRPLTRARHWERKCREMVQCVFSPAGACGTGGGASRPGRPVTSASDPF